MPDRIPPLHGPPLLLAEGGANHHETHSSLASFRLATRLGATALGASAWLTADGEVAVARSDSTGGFRRRPVTSLDRGDLPAAVPTLGELYDDLGTAVPLAITVGDDAAFRAVLAVARDRSAVDRLWIRHRSLEHLARWRDEDTDVHLVNTVRMTSLKEGAERRAADLRTAGVDALEARAEEWTGGSVALLHRFGRLAWASDANHHHVIVQLFRMGLDAIGGDHPDRLIDAKS